MLPASLHLAESGLVRGIAFLDTVFEVTILLLNDLIGCLRAQREITGAAKLCACHGFHRNLPVVELRCAPLEYHVRMDDDSGESAGDFVAGRPRNCLMRRPSVQT